MTKIMILTLTLTDTRTVKVTMILNHQTMKILYKTMTITMTKTIIGPKIDKRKTIKHITGSLEESITGGKTIMADTRVEVEVRVGTIIIIGETDTITIRTIITSGGTSPSRIILTTTGIAMISSQGVEVEAEAVIITEG